VAALGDPRAYPDPVSRVELIETHISWVFLAGDRVFKVKKPVDLGFLDFTTLERRRHFCEEEVRLNRRLTEDIYLGVVDLHAGSRPFTGPGPVIDAAVAMRRLPHDRMLDVMIRDGDATPTLLETIGETIARFHAQAATGGEIDALGRLPVIRGNWEENFAQTAELPEDVLPNAARRAVRAWVDEFTAREAGRFTARVAAGRIRDCHGDLQAAHVCCTEPIQIFDCIEFNHRFRFADTAAEIAFLAMDLDRLGRPDLAMAFLNAYLTASGDYDAVPLLDFYRAYRAFVRGKVHGFQIGSRPGVTATAQDFFALVLRYGKPRRTPRLLITTGVMGSGKTTVASRVGRRLGAIVVRTDAVRKHLAGVPLDHCDRSQFGAGLYGPAMARRTYDAALAIAGDVLAAGWPVVVDGAFSASSQRADAARLAGRLGVPFGILWCDAPDSVLAERLDRRGRDAREVSDGRVELLARHRAEYESPAGEPGVTRIDAETDVEAALNRLRTAG
jgi:uncharacterized protein